MSKNKNMVIGTALAGVFITLAGFMVPNWNLATYIGVFFIGMAVGVWQFGKK